MEALKNWMKDAANILFDDSKNDLRSLPRSVFEKWLPFSKDK